MKYVLKSLPVVFCVLMIQSAFAVDDSSLPVISDSPNFDPAKVSVVQTPAVPGTRALGKAKHLPPAPTTKARIIAMMKKPNVSTRALSGGRIPSPKGRAHINFESDSARITPSSYGLLNEWGGAIQSPELSNAEIIVRGHTDSQGGDDYNQELGMRRAMSVKAFLVENFGIGASRIQVQSRGEEEPYVSNATNSGRAVNRRVEFVADYNTNTNNSFNAQSESTNAVPVQEAPVQQEEPVYE